VKDPAGSLRHLPRKVKALRIVSDEVFERAQARRRVSASSAEHLRSGGRAKYVLSGLLTCGTCGAHCVMGDSFKYVCSSYWNGGTNACSNHTRIRRDAIEATLLDPDRADSAIAGLLAPDRVARMAAELERMHVEHVRKSIARAGQRPRELNELIARIERLRERLKAGDPDMATDELQAAIDRAEAKRQELDGQQPLAKASAKVLSILPRAAALYRDQVRRGLNGNPPEAMKARAVLRNLLVDGKIVLSPGKEAGSLWAKYSLAPAVLLGTAGVLPDS
jgi:site-specific DNA recombinase